MAKRPNDISDMTRAGLNLIQQGLSIYDADLKLALCNRRFGEMFGLPEHLTQPGASFVETIRFLVDNGEYGDVANPDDFVTQRAAQARAFEPHYMERTRANGRTISVEGSPLPAGGWVTVYTDITDIKTHERLLRARSVDLAERVLEHAERTAAANRRLAAANAALEETKHALTETEQRTRMTAEMMPAHIAHIGTDLRYTFSNRKLSSVLMGCPSDIIGMTIKDALGPDRFALIESALARAFDGEPNVLEFNDPQSARRARVAFTPELGDGGTVTGVYLLSMDITEEAQARAVLAQTHKRELAAQLTSGLAHDFANLLTIILGMQGKLARMDLGDEAQRLVSAATAAARRGGVLLDRLARISGKREMHLTPTDLGQLLADTVTLATPALPEGIALSAWAKGFDGPVMLDGGSLSDALLNLVLNARDAIGTGPGAITLHAHPEADTWIDITVQDTGPGFSPDALQRGLDPFFTTKGGEGSGLGLSMVYDLIKMAGGTIRLGNTGDGAQIRMRLPLRPAPYSDAAARMVLLVEDSPDIRLHVRELLIGMGHQVIEASTAAEARELARIDGIGLILSDLSLEGEASGLDLLRMLTADGITLPARLMTSRPRGDALRMAAAAEYPLIAKPFNASELAAFIAPLSKDEAAE